MLIKAARTAFAEVLEQTWPSMALAAATATIVVLCSTACTGYVQVSIAIAGGKFYDVEHFSFKAHMAASKFGGS